MHYLQKTHGTIGLKPRAIQETFITVIINIAQKENLFFKPAQLLMKFNERTMDKTENEHYAEDQLKYNAFCSSLSFSIGNGQQLTDSFLRRINSLWLI